MKITIVEQRGQPPLQDGWVLGLAPPAIEGEQPFAGLRALARSARDLVLPAKGRRKIGWSAILRVDGLDAADGDAKLVITREHVTFFRFWRWKNEDRELALQRGDNALRVEIPWNALSWVTIEVWQEKALGNRQTQTLHLLTRRHRVAAYLSLLVGGAVPMLALLHVWGNADASIQLGDTSVSRLVMGLLSVLGVSLSALTGSTVLDLVLGTVGKTVASGKARSSSPILRAPLALFVGTVLLGLVVLPLGFRRVCNYTSSKPEIHGYGTPIAARNHQEDPAPCVLLWSPFSPPTLAPGSSSFKMEEDEDAGTGLLDFRSSSVTCTQDYWKSSLLDGRQCGTLRLEPEQGCTLKNDQRFDSAVPTCAEVRDAVGPIELANKPFGGSAIWEHDGTRLTCTAPAKTTFELFTLREVRRLANPTAESDATDLVGEALVECRQDRLEFDLVAQSQLDASEPTLDRDIPICVPRNASECRVTVNGGDDAVVELPTTLLEGRKITIDGSVCTVGYQGKEYGPARVARVGVDGLGEGEVTIRAGVCTSRRLDPKLKELRVILPAKGALRWRVLHAPLGTSFSFPRGFLDKREIDIMGDGAPSDRITCAAGADTLVLLDAAGLGPATSVDLDAESSAIRAHDAGKAVWMCVDKQALRLPDAHDKAGNKDREAQCAARGARSMVRAGELDVWLDLNGRTGAPPAVRRCTDVVNYCCHVCVQFGGDPGASSKSVVAPCSAHPPTPGGQSKDCSRYPAVETLTCK